MTLDIRGGLKITKLSRNPYVVFEELISNAIDSFLIRRNGGEISNKLEINIVVNFFKKDLIGDVEDMSISCRDNGCGFGDEQLSAFLTKDTSYKDDLTIAGIGKCLGSGRIQFFHHFSVLILDSTYFSSGDFFRRSMKYSEPKKTIDLSDFSSDEGDGVDIGANIFLENIRQNVRERLFLKTFPSELYSAPELKKQMLLTFMQRLISLGDSLGEFEINFSSFSEHKRNDDPSRFQEDSLKISDLPVVTSEREVDVEECDPRTGEGLGTYQKFKISHYKLDAKKYSLPCNEVAFCAKSSPVKDITSKYFRTQAERKNPIAGYFHLVLIESDYFDSHVNEQRDDFEGIPEEIPNNDLYSLEKISYSLIGEAIDPEIVEMVVPSDWKRELVLRDVTEKFGISEAMLQDTSTRIRYGESAQVVAERVLKKYQEKVIDETSEIFNLKEEIKNIRPDTEEFRIKINELAWKYTSSLKSFDMASLSQLIVRRTAIVEVLDLACRKNLTMQVVGEGERRKDERIIHSVFFPMKKDSAEVVDHDMWLLSEEYHYYDYIASDVPLSNINWDDGSKVFENDIDVEFQKILSKRVSDNEGKRPDIALFNKEGSAVIVEFKAPGVSVDEHIGDLMEYAYLLGAKSKGKLRKFYGYLIGDTVNPLRLNGWIPFSEGKGWFNSAQLNDPFTRQSLGETYFEILYFNDVVDRAKKRIGIYQNKINLSINKNI